MTLYGAPAKQGLVMTTRTAVILIVTAAGLGACSTAGQATGTAGYNATTSNPAICMLSPFSRSADGTVSKADMEAGIRAGFASADTSADGRLNYDEMAVLNESRATSCDITPFRDWSGTGLVGMDDYATRYRSAFEQVDLNKDGFATLDELARYRRDTPKKKVKAPPSEQSPQPTTGIPGQGNTGSPY